MTPIRLIRDLAELHGTVYFELLPGPYTGTCCNQDSLFVAEEVFALIEPLISRHHPGFDHYAFTTIGSTVWPRIAADLRELSRIALSAASMSDLRPHVGLRSDETARDFEAAFDENRKALATFARELAVWVENHAANRECISVLGL